MGLHRQVVWLEIRHALHAVDELMTESEHAPSPRDVITRGEDLQQAERRRARGEDCPHTNWAIVAEQDQRRLGICAACGTERWVDAARLLTATERGLEHGYIVTHGDEQ